MRKNILATISRLNLDNEGWKQTICRAYQLLRKSNGEVLGAIIDFLFEAASHCQYIPQAVRAVHARLESLGAEVSSYVFDLLSKTVNSRREIEESMLREIGSVLALDGNCLTNSSELFPDQEKGTATNCLVDGPLKDANHHFSDIFLLINVLAIPSLAGEASQVFERGIAHGFIEDHSVAIILEKYAQRFSVSLEPSSYQHQVSEKEKKEESFVLKEFLP
ncbi:hypothetical protein RCOM_0272080 [Ricinus communis]|uniref:Uncharacterized protein n=1 Tax=Ricinus communis TaxID=3988 RepID=B9T130_RICCO|nr:hypothetical protein RCOM_0272080 [Ricinus communis]